MSRPPKELSDDDLDYAWSLRKEGMGFASIAMQVSIRRKAFAVSITAKQRRDRMVSERTLRRLMLHGKTEPRQNPKTNTNNRQSGKTAMELDARWSQPQTDSKGGNS